MLLQAAAIAKAATGATTTAKTAGTVGDAAKTAGVVSDTAKINKHTIATINNNGELVVGKYSYSKTAGSHVADRPYMHLESVIDEILATNQYVPDAYIANGRQYKVPGSWNGRQGTWELVIDDNNKISHILHKPFK